MTTCKNCKHFNVDEDKPFLGFCTIELPAWFRREINTSDMPCTCLLYTSDAADEL